MDAARLPCVPHLAVYLTDLTYLQTLPEKVAKKSARQVGVGQGGVVKIFSPAHLSLVGVSIASDGVCVESDCLLPEFLLW